MRNIVLILFLLITIAPNTVSAQYAVAFSESYPPYNYVNENGELVGFNIDILNAIKKLYNTEIATSANNWKAINKALSNGEIQAIGGTHYPGSPEKGYLYTRSAINTSHCFLYNTKHVSNFSLELLRTTKQPLVAMWENDVLIHYVLSINPAARFIYINNYEKLISSLDREDITCIIAQRIGSMYYAKKLGKNYIRTSEHRILERNMGFKVAENSPELAKILNNGLEVILSNGEYQRIYDKWITDYNKNDNDWHNYLKYILIISSIIAVLFLLLLIINRILQTRVKNKTKDLQQQLQLNSQIMIELEEQKFKAEESDKMKSAFLANMSHEIRTPMNGILGFAELLKSEDYSHEEQKQFVEIILQSGDRMLNTINNIIDVSKLESGAEKKQISAVNITNIMHELQSFFTPEARSKGIKLIFSENILPSTKDFYTDEYKLNSILTNLIKNALKFTSKGEINVTYLMDEKEARFTVSDTGIGIAKDKQSAVFEQFVQANFSHSSGYEGSGLGLSISKGYVELLQGEIKLESILDKGTTFDVRIPNSIKATPKPVEDTPKRAVKEHAPTKFKIVIAEDDTISLTFLKQILKDVSENILHAANGHEAVEMLKDNPDTDIVLMDIKMPDLNGFEATKQIRKFNKNVFIIAQTAYAQENYKDEVLKAGCNAYISKPINKNKLIEIISTCREQNVDFSKN